MTHNNQLLLPQITHDLRNYIGGISGLANIALENLITYIKKQEAIGIKPDANLKEISECMEMIAPYSNEALCYVEDLLNNSQMQSGKFSLGKLEECDVGELVKELLAFNQSFISDHQITFEVNIAENLPKLKTDILRLKQILINLITNAVKYSPKGNKVEITISQNYNSQIQIIIKDSGIGMTKQEIQMALNGYGKNIDKSNLNKPIDSHGLGMPIVKQLCELLRAQMTIESEKNKGTKVTICFS
ncbi:MAG: HAMP domain-containing sensor histidine kinase [Pseudomonadota bacterium]